MPQSKGICFLDVYLDENFQEKPPAPHNDCYRRVNYKLHLSDDDFVGQEMTFSEQKEFLDLLMLSWYYKNEQYLIAKLHSFNLSLRNRVSGKWNIEVGGGGDGKGKAWMLERGALGQDNCGTMEFNCLCDPTEFRKSAHQVWNKVAWRIQESNGKRSVQPELFKGVPEGHVADDGMLNCFDKT